MTVNLHFGGAHRRGFVGGLLLGLLGLAGVPAGCGAENLDDQRTRAFASFGAVLRADADVIARTRADLETVLAARPDDALARVHLGWLLVRQAWNESASDALRLARAGFTLMDAAVAAAPDDVAVRLVRARSDAQVPAMLEREAVATADFVILVTAARRWGSDGLSPELRREILFQAGGFALRQRQPARAVELLNEAAKVAAELPSDDDVQSMLALAREELSSQDHAEDANPDQGPPATP